MVAAALKVLGQANPLAATPTQLYGVPNSAGACATASSIIICNRGSSQAKVRVSIRVNNAADDPSQYLYYDLAIPANDTFIATVGLTLSINDRVYCQTDTATIAFSLYGEEIS